MTDPDGNRWEVYTVLEDIEQKADAATTCCLPAAGRVDRAEPGSAGAGCC